jgi:hypothetical protein
VGNNIPPLGNVEAKQGTMNFKQHAFNVMQMRKGPVRLKRIETTLTSAPIK